MVRTMICAVIFSLLLGGVSRVQADVVLYTQATDSSGCDLRIAL